MDEAGDGIGMHGTGRRGKGPVVLVRDGVATKGCSRERARGSFSKEEREEKNGEGGGKGWSGRGIAEDRIAAVCPSIGKPDRQEGTVFVFPSHGSLHVQ